MVSADITVAHCNMRIKVKQTKRNRLKERRHRQVSGLPVHVFTVRALQSGYGNPCPYAHAHVDTGSHAERIQAAQSTNIHRFVCLQIFLSRSSCSLSACRRIPAVVCTRIHITSHEPCQIQYNITLTPNTAVIPL